MKQEVLVISVDGLICAHSYHPHLLILIHGYKGPKQHETYSHYIGVVAYTFQLFVYCDLVE